MLDEFARTYRRAGGHITTEMFEGQPHNFVSRHFGSDDARRAVDIISDFVLTGGPAA